MDEDEPAWKSINIALVADLSDHDYRFYRWAQGEVFGEE
jgi:hypothetical protein